MTENRKRNKTLTIRLTDAEYNFIHKKAAKAQKSLTDYIVTLAAEVPINVAEDIKPLLKEMKRIGNNINQITMKINSGAFTSYDFQDVIDEQKKIYEELHRIARKG